MIGDKQLAPGGDTIGRLDGLPVVLVNDQDPWTIVYQTNGNQAGAWIPVEGYSGFLFDVSHGDGATPTFTLNVESYRPLANQPIVAVANGPVARTATWGATQTVAGLYEGGCSGLDAIRFRVTGYSGSGNVIVRMRRVSTPMNPVSLLAGENLTDNRLMVETAWSTTSITTQTTTTVKSGAGKLGGFIIPTQIASATVKIYDNTAASGTVLVDTITLPATLLNEGPLVYLPLGQTFGTGLTVITGGATMAIDILYL